MYLKEPKSLLEDENETAAEYIVTFRAKSAMSTKSQKDNKARHDWGMASHLATACIASPPNE
jgi:hypothetical protein